MVNIRDIINKFPRFVYLDSAKAATFLPLLAESVESGRDVEFKVGNAWSKHYNFDNNIESYRLKPITITKETETLYCIYRSGIGMVALHLYPSKEQAEKAVKELVDEQSARDFEIKKFVLSEQ